MFGKFILEKLSSFPSFNLSEDKGRLFFYDTDQSLYVGTDAGYETIIANNEINELLDVDTPSPNGQQVLTYNSGTGNWEASETIIANNEINELLDVDTPSPSGQQVLTYNSGTGNWEANDLNGGTGINYSSGIISLDIDSLTTETSASPSGDYIAFYDSSAGSHKNITPRNLSYYHTQSSSSSTWNINHNLEEKYCHVTVIDDSDDIILPENISLDDSNNLTINFSTSITGTAKISIT